MGAGEPTIVTRGGLTRRTLLARAAATGAALAIPGCGGGNGGDGGGTPRGATGPSAPATGRGGALTSEFFGLAAEVAHESAENQRYLLNRMADAGAGTLRHALRWAQLEETPGERDWSTFDLLVASCARSGLTVLPILFEAPPIFARRLPAGTHGTPPPRDNAAFAGFARECVERYGPDGLLWRKQPDLPPHPIRAWQVWNEPNLEPYWGGRPDAGEYLALLRDVYPAIKDADPKAEVVTGGVPDSHLGIPMRRYVRQLVRGGARSAFDTLAIHPYARTDNGVVNAVEGIRDVMRREGAARVGLRVTEFGWASGGPRGEFTVDPATHALFVSRTLRRLALDREALNLRGLVYFGWRDGRPYEGGKDFWGLHTGLVRLDGTAKPALEAFTTAIKGVEESGD